MLTLIIEHMNFIAHLGIFVQHFMSGIQSVQVVIGKTQSHIPLSGILIGGRHVMIFRQDIVIHIELRESP